MKKVIILGGGIAGLSAASFLAAKGYQTEIIETSPKLGGRAYSFYDQFSGYSFDNGQHIMMGCYKETLSFFELIGATGNITIQKNLDIRFLKQGFKEYRLKASSAPYPFNLLSALLNYEAVSFQEKISFLKIFLKIPLYSSRDLKRISVKEWLLQENVSENAIKSFWEIICIGAMNTETELASAEMFIKILKEIFFKGRKNSLIIIPNSGLSDTYCNPAEEFITKNNGIISKGESVEGISMRNNKVINIKTDKRVIEDFDFVISAIPYYSLKRIIPQIKELPFIYSPILSAQIILKSAKLDDTFWGLIDSPVHWIFSKGTHLSVVISSAHKFVNLENDAIKKIILDELFEYTCIEEDDILSCRILKEKRATFIPGNNILDKRPRVNTLLSNFYLAGDWVKTGLPATLESAVLSARMVTDIIAHV